MTGQDPAGAIRDRHRQAASRADVRLVSPALAPRVPVMARLNRAFMHRTTRPGVKSAMAPCGVPGSRAAAWASTIGSLSQ
jgi:hypothetical protein